MISYQEVHADNTPQKSWDIEIQRISEVDSLLSKAIYINTWVNDRVDYKADSGDYWQTPEETRRHGRGDCEDYALMKLEALLDSGVPPEYLQIGILERKGQKGLHAVLLVAWHGDILVLDEPAIPAMYLSDYSDITDYHLLGTTGLNGWSYSLPEYKYLIPIFDIKLMHEHERHLQSLTNTRGE